MAAVLPVGLLVVFPLPPAHHAWALLQVQLLQLREGHEHGADVVLRVPLQALQHQQRRKTDTETGEYAGPCSPPPL